MVFNNGGQDEMKTATIDDYSFCHEASTSTSEGTSTPNTDHPNNDTGVPFMIHESKDKETPDWNKLIKVLVDMVSKSQASTAEGNVTTHIVDLIRTNERLSSANERLTGTFERLGAKIECLGQEVMNGREENLRLRQENDALKSSVDSNRREDKPTSADNRKIESIAKGIQDSLSASMTVLQENALVNNKKELQQLIVKLKEENAEMKIDIEHELVQLKGEITDSNQKLQKLFTSSVGSDVNKLLVPLKEDIVTLQQQIGRLSRPSIQPNPPKPRGCWKKSKSHVATFGSKRRCCDVLDCEPLIFGNKYKWSIKVVSTGGDCVGLGVASTIHKFDFNKWLGYQKGGWSYDSGGYAWHDDEVIQSNLPEFKDGSKLTFLL